MTAIDNTQTDASLGLIGSVATLLNTGLGA